MPFNNPFSFGSPVKDDGFIGRKRELRRVLGRLYKGESTAIVGDPHIGKTSFLTHVREQAAASIGDAANWHFSFIDIHIFGAEFTAAQFWEHALTPIKTAIDKENAPAAVAEHYELCRKNAFGNITLERFFTELAGADWHFVLMIDEFDSLLFHPVLHCAEFYGGLRSLASRSGDAFALIIASRAQISRLNTETRKFTPTGSPFFNIFLELELGPLTETDVRQLLMTGKERFAKHDRHAIRVLGGRHPFLLQAAAAAMWDAFDDEEVNRLPYVTRTLYREQDQYFVEAWRNWTPELRKAFTIVGILHQAHILKEKYRLSEFIQELPNLKPELSDLEHKGLISAGDRCEGGYCIEPEIMLTWLADELIRAGRTENAFSDWVHERELEGAFTAGELDVFKNAVLGVSNTLKKGALTFIDSFAQALGASMAKKM